MKKILMSGLVLLMTGTAWAQSNDTGVAPQGQPPTVTAEAPAQQPPMNPIARAMMESRRRRQEAPPTAQGTETPKQAQPDKTVPVPAPGKSFPTPEETNRNQLIRNLPYQPATAAPVQAASSGPARVEAPKSSKLVVCVVNGFERSGVSSADCKAQGGREVTTAEVLRTDGGGKGR